MNFKDVISTLNNIANLPSIDELKVFIFTLQEKNLDLLAKNAELMNKVTALETQIADYESWDKEKKNYELFTFPQGATVYKLTDTEQLFCPKCFNEKRIAIHLQPHISRGSILTCPNCKNEYRR